MDLNPKKTEKHKKKEKKEKNIDGHFKPLYCFNFMKKIRNILSFISP